MTINIERKITAYRVKKDQQEVAPQDIDPRTLRIDRRPNGTLEAVSEKIEYSTHEGKKKVYLLVSFLPVEGRQNGKPVTVERPVEFFYPVGQDQWIAATMRSLSLAARGGYVAQALADLRKVVWANGPVRCGKNAHGKPAFHESEVAALAWAIQRILIRRGFLDENGDLSSLEEQAKPAAPAHTEPEPAAPAGTKASMGGCPECRGDLTLMDGCPTCVDCGYSKCG